MVCIPIGKETVDTGMDDESEHHVASGHAQHRTWCDSRGLAGMHVKRELGRGDEDPFLALDYAYLNLDCTEDDDAQDEVGPKQVACLGFQRCENCKLCCNLSAREMCECVRRVMACVLVASTWLSKSKICGNDR